MVYTAAVRCTAAILCVSGVDLSPAWLDAVRVICDELVLCAPAVLPELARGGLPVVASRVAGSSLLGSLHAALCVARHDAVLALDGGQPPAVDLLRRLAEDPSGSNALVVDRRASSESASGLPGRYRRGCLGTLRRALRERRFDLGAILVDLHASCLCC
jgi:hypothetical protein